ncbi:inactive rhomboid protein 2-like [Biomphalaria glabrata]|uniref:Inactive rhomboid protein 2-like n=1 Tax=Biomphalaria glabrata TaxID=6526 RepID=A0A2C9JG56_BIOGL|nr:inactive rhomboid protein 2-like [Biomphalaria glabrata]XP_055876721.1 inactive rhomboid protein 2-like [Biomphalaria glabrata]
MDSRLPSQSEDLSPSQSKTKNYRQKARKSIAVFFGVSEEDEMNQMRWEKRRMRIASSIGKGLKDEYFDQQDMTDGRPSVIDPLSRTSRQMSRYSTHSAMGAIGRRDTRKKSVIAMTMQGIAALNANKQEAQRRKSFKYQGQSFSRGQSFARGSMKPTLEAQHSEDAFSLVDDVFFDESPVTATRVSGPAGGPGPGWRRKPPEALPSTPGADMVDGFGFQKIKEKVISTARKHDKRQIGMGVLNNVTRQRLKSTVLMNKEIKQQLDDIDDHRPFFTYWVTFVQIVVFVVSLAVYGIAPIGFQTTIVSQNVRMPNLAIQTETHVEYDNLWIGPRQVDLIHLGAKYSPCMRVDENLNEAIGYDRAEERESACCIRNDGSGCVQTVQSGCSNVLSRWEKWAGNDSVGVSTRSSGSVCGQDPKYCNNPSSTPPFEWPDDITHWPLCLETAKPNQSLASHKDEHMSCEILGRPCCFGIQGECIITTREHCDLKRGFFHEEATLCSQVNCFEEICGMIPFANPSYPDQFYRLWTSLFLHGGLLHLLLSIVFQMWIMRDLEKLMGAIRISIIYIGAGVAGNLASCTFIPYQVEAGPSGSQFGIAACLLVEVLQSYQMYKHPGLAIMKVLGPVLFFFLLGLLPWLDNWAHLFGFFFGFLLAFALMPYVSFGQFDKRRKIISIIVCLGGAIGLFTILVLVFYVAPLTDCHWCVYLNCIPFTADFCANMGVKIKKNATYSSYT